MELLAIMCVFSVPLLAIWTHHRRKMEELRLRLPGGGDQGVRAEIDALRQEVRALRDTCTQYDLSFDTALQRMEQRVQGIERRVSVVQPENDLQMRAGR